jgi:nicotinamide mononucleotide (NMN) deamidase PncC
VPYDRRLKVDVLGTPDIPAVSEAMARAMAERVCVVLGSDVGLAVTGVAGPDPLEGIEPGTVWIGLWLDGRAEAAALNIPFDRERIRQFTTISSLNLLRTRLLARVA